MAGLSPQQVEKIVERATPLDSFLTLIVEKKKWWCCGVLQRNRTSRIYSDIWEEIYYGNWLTQLWRLRCAVIDHMVTRVSFLRNYYTVFHKGCTILSSYLPRIPISLYPHQHFFFCLIGNFSVFWDLQNFQGIFLYYKSTTNQPAKTPRGKKPSG